MSDAAKYSIVSILGVGVVALTAVELLKLADFSDTASAAKVIAALIALLGVVFTGILTVMTALINRSVQREGQKLTELQQEANAAQASVAEQRLKIEAAVKAVELFGSATGQGTAQQNTGALFALVNLGYEDFALHLLDQLWPAGKVTRHGAVWVIARALESKRPETQLGGAEILAEHAALLLNEGRTDLDWPGGIAGWPHSIPLLGRHAVMTALLRAFVSLDPGKVDERVERGIVGLLVNARETDPSQQVRASADLALSSLLQLYEDSEKLTMDDAAPRSLGALRAKVKEDLKESRQAVLQFFVDLGGEVELWVSKRKARASQRLEGDSV